MSHDPIFSDKSQQSSGFKLRSPDFKFSAPSGFRQENLNYKVWDHLGLLVRMSEVFALKNYFDLKDIWTDRYPKPKACSNMSEVTPNTAATYQAHFMCWVLRVHIESIFIITMQEEH